MRFNAKDECANQERFVMTTKTGTISVWTGEVAPEADQKNALPRIRRVSKEVTEVSTEIVQKNLAGAIREFQKSVEELPRSSGGFEVDEIELAFVVTGSGGVELIGKLEASVEASIKIKLKRSR